MGRITENAFKNKLKLS